MGSDFSIASEIPSDKMDIAVLHLTGWLDAHSEPQLVSAVENARGAGAMYVLIDLAGISTITSAGIRAIQKAYRLMTPKDESMGGRLKLCSAQPPVFEVLNVTGILISMPMYESADIAIDSFGR